MRTFFFFFFFSLCFSLLEMMEICFGSTKMGISYREKAFHAGKKIRKNDFAPSEKYTCYAPAANFVTVSMICSKNAYTHAKCGKLCNFFWYNVQSCTNKITSRVVCFFVLRDSLHGTKRVTECSLSTCAGGCQPLKFLRKRKVELISKPQTLLLFWYDI